MAAYPGTETERRVPHETLESAVARIFAACGMPDACARLLAATLADADLHGVHSHGVMRVPDYAGRLTPPEGLSAVATKIAGVRGGVNPEGRPRVVRDAGAALVIDGDNAMGQIACDFAMDTVIERARRTGVAFAAIGNSNHCGAMAWYVRKAVAADMIGLASTNALPTMAPWGGADRIVGMNPLGVGIPAGSEAPFVMDSAFAACARGKVVVYNQKGHALPPGWALDRDGLPTTDPAAALDGLLRPIGDYKGVNVAMALGIMSTMLSGAGYGTRLGNLDDGPHAGRDGQFVMALDIGALTDLAEFKREMDAVIDEIHRSRRAPGTERIYCAGELEHETALAYRRDGIPLNDETLSDLASTAAARGVDLSDLLEAARGRTNLSI
ncbi:MAG: Ldh family oxidoreductase [Ectothiorhodospiraceae bacterium]|nr:Ldh family oxidoreductase [Chromatiales bacterium]MCP5153546.1 Ldh family oxidoreductase [Ectothiorhodospiraceae bacterium]